MNILVKISWRNIWRNHQRSLTMILAIAAGLWGGIFAASLSMGLMEQRFKTGIEQEFSHVQIHEPEFLKEKTPAHSIKEWKSIQKELEENSKVAGFTGRTLVNGMFATANLTSGINIIGINPSREANTTNLDDNIVEGTYFDQDRRDPLLIGKKLAEKTKAREGSRVVLTFQSLDNELVSISCRVAGIFQTANSMYDERNIYMLQSDLNEYLGADETVNEVAVLLDDMELAGDFAGSYQEKYPELTVRTWADVSPQLAFYHEMGITMFMIILLIILLALAFGLLNTMLMSVFERTKELGMLMSIGMSKKRVFAMILLETVFLTLTGAFLGMFLGYSTILFFENRGLDMSAFGGDSLQQFGFDAVVYPGISPLFFVVLTIMVFLTALLTAVYPAFKALRLQPAEAVKEE